MFTLLFIACQTDTPATATPATAPATTASPATASPATETPATPADVGDPEGARQLLTTRCIGCHDTIDGLPLSDPMAFVGAPGPGGLAWIEPGDPTASALYLKVTGGHREHGIAGTIMPPTPSGIVIPEDGVAILRAWILDDDVVLEEERLGPDADARDVIERHCIGCHGPDDMLDLSDPSSLAGRPGSFSLYPLVEPGRPWRSSLYRAALDHELSAFLPRTELDVPAQDLATLARFIGPDNR